MCENFISKVITGNSGHAPRWENKCGTVRVREKNVTKTAELVTALGSSFH